MDESFQCDRENEFIQHEVADYRRTTGIKPCNNSKYLPVLTSNKIQDADPLIINTRAPQGCMLRPLLYSLFTHGCVATHVSNSIIKFADNTTVLGLITNNDETAYRVRRESPGGVVSGK